MTSEDIYSFGPRYNNGDTLFRLFAPQRRDVVLEIEGRDPVSMNVAADGFLAIHAAASPGTRYRFRVDGTAVPDPASRRQSGGVHGWSVLERPHSHAWRANDWRGRDWEETVFYEIHAGLAGGFKGTADRLEFLRDTGFTAIELMPIAAFPGDRNWGYDGVLPFAPHEAYGSPDELKALVDRAHELGLSIYLDVVYNHFGPDGNYLSLYAPEFFRRDIHTPWGAAVDFRQESVRRFFIENARYWIDEFRFDGLRLDAVHAITPSDWLTDLAREVKSAAKDRKIHLVVENDRNEATLLRQGFDAQWNDDFHHATHVLLTAESHGYYADFADEPAGRLARTLAEGFAYQGEYSENQKRARGTLSSDLPSTAFVCFLQNHDQIGNRALGERLSALVHPRALEAAVALLLLAPSIPLVFMGEEIGSETPFLYFTDHGPGLAKAVREGRAREFSFSANDLPDPNGVSSFERSRPKNGGQSEHWTSLYRALLKRREDTIVPRLRGTSSIYAKAISATAVMAGWRMGDGSRLTIACNLGEAAVDCRMPLETPIWGEKKQATLSGRSTVAWLVEA